MTKEQSWLWIIAQLLIVISCQDFCSIVRAQNIIMNCVHFWTFFISTTFNIATECCRGWLWLLCLTFSLRVQAGCFWYYNICCCVCLERVTLAADAYPLRHPCEPPWPRLSQRSPLWNPSFAPHRRTMHLLLTATLPQLVPDPLCLHQGGHPLLSVPAFSPLLWQLHTQRPKLKKNS